MALLSSGAWIRNIRPPQPSLILTQKSELEKRGNHLEQEFKLDPRVSERTDSHTFASCEAIQVPTFFILIDYPDDVQKVKGTLEGGDDVYEGVPAKEQLNIFYPPQVKTFSLGENLTPPILLL